VLESHQYYTKKIPTGNAAPVGDAPTYSVFNLINMFSPPWKTHPFKIVKGVPFQKTISSQNLKKKSIK